MAASNCGQILQEREDPFDLKVMCQKEEIDHICFYLLLGS